MRDDIVEEVQKVRRAYGERFGFNLEAIGRDLREQERQSGRTIVNYLSDRGVRPVTEKREVESLSASSSAEVLESN